MWVLAALGIPGLVAVLWIDATISPVGLGIGLLFAAIELVIGILLFRVGPLWPSAGWLYVLCCLIWGSFVSTALVVPSATAWMDITDKLGWDLVSASFAGGYPEEIAKAFGVFLILYSFRKLNRPWHGFVTGGLVGLGFDVNENLLYGAVGAQMDANTDGEGALMMWGLRMLAGPGLHIVMTALAGWGIGLALFRKNSLRALWWVVFAFALHFAWNMLLPGEEILIIQYVVLSLIVYPLFIWVYVKAVRAEKSDNSYVLLM